MSREKSHKTYWEMLSAGERRFFAYHEAGHVVAVVMRGGVIERVWVEPDKNGLAGVFSYDMWLDRGFIAFAGPFADCYFRWLGCRGSNSEQTIDDYLELSRDEFYEEGCLEGPVEADDWGIIDHALLGIEAVNRHSLLREWQAELINEWPAIEALAKVLEKNKELGGVEAMELVNGHLSKEHSGRSVGSALER